MLRLLVNFFGDKYFTPPDTFLSCMMTAGASKLVMMWWSIYRAILEQRYT